ncbi:MAG: glycoside hydrolase family 2 TIM barrel-domain containing protein [Bacteroidales bacterium]|nr:glycoside hydrolase family 2 TIM barrel-domain containing protein [Bacteroidales bacterium]
MNIKALPLSFLFTFFTALLSAQQTEIKFLSGTDAANTVAWDFFCTDGRNSGSWTHIDVPSNWEMEGFGTYNYGHDWKNEDIQLGKEHGLYKHAFDVPREWKGKTVYIVFDGSMTDTEVKINGKPAGDIHQGGFYRFRYNISALLKYGNTNLLEMDVAKHSSNESVNKAERQADFWIFGGIFRPVFLEVLPGIHMQRTAIDAKADGSFTSFIVLNESKSDYDVTVELFELDGKKISGNIEYSIEKGVTEVWVSGNFTNIKAWNPEWPHLYDVKISLNKDAKTLHEVTERIGFRTVEFREHDGFYINGEKVIFKGVNRHSFWPETGRCLSEENHLADIRLMKEMNMNAIRSSHYVPDKRFLELCDSIGLFVLNEVTGWQDGYDTIVGPKLVKETILKDENHPSVVIWNHGNEGGWNFHNEKNFHVYDIQSRPVLYPWLFRNGADTRHYIEFDYGIARFTYGNDPFMPTELLHGLYDGGHGAGLEAYWRNYESSPLLAGGFLWVLADEALLRTDKPGTLYDSDGNHAPDGIVGPHREKEGSFYTIKEIWSPVQVRPMVINREWGGKLFLENKFIYTNLEDCSFSWSTIRSEIGSSEENVVSAGVVASPDAAPGETAAIHIDCADALQEADIFQFKAVDHHGQELYTWSWPVVQPDEKAKELAEKKEGGDEDKIAGEVKVNETGNSVIVSASGIEVVFSKNDGTLQSVIAAGKTVSLNGGPVPVGVDTEITGTMWEKDSNGNFMMTITTSRYPEKITWKFMKNGLLGMEASPLNRRMQDVDFIGISFNYPEDKCEGVKWMGRGPYRVWKNRLKGSNFGVWEKEYNNTITGESFNDLVYPEFKGYHGNLYWATLETNEADFTIVSETSNLYFRLFTPGKPAHVQGDTYPPFPEGDLSFLYEIPAIGTKFKQASKLGPASQKGVYGGHLGDQVYPIKLWFDFR